MPPGGPPFYSLPMYVDAHFHADDLSAFHPGLAAEYSSLGVVGLASVHDRQGLEATRTIMSEAGPCLVSFGLHPQLPVMDAAVDLFASAEARSIDAIGECGFDFFGDTPALERTEANERTQRDLFEPQLELAERLGMPIVLHWRRASDLLFAYAKRLSALPAVFLHSWGGPANEALDFLARCPRALFSLSNQVINGNRKARASAASLPLSAIVTETDAPYQPPRGFPQPGGGRRPLLRRYSCFADIPRTVAEIAALRGVPAEAVAEAVAANFQRVFPVKGNDALRR